MSMYDGPQICGGCGTQIEDCRQWAMSTPVCGDSACSQRVLYWFPVIRWYALPDGSMDYDEHGRYETIEEARKVASELGDGWEVECSNCDNRRCMDCVSRTMHDRCEDSCPVCSGRPLSSGSVTFTVTVEGTDDSPLRATSPAT